MGRRTGGHGGVCSRRGACPAGMRPPFLFCLAKRETGRARSKEKSVGALRCSGPPRARGSADRCKRRFCLTFGHARLFYEVDTAVPWRMVPRSSGCKDAFDQLLFPRVPLRYALSGYSQELLPCPMLQLSSTARPAAAKREDGCIPNFPGLKVSPRAARFRL